jgi:hypothetical protein
MAHDEEDEFYMGHTDDTIGASPQLRRRYARDDIAMPCDEYYDSVQKQQAALLAPRRF